MKKYKVFELFSSRGSNSVIPSNLKEKEFASVEDVHNFLRGVGKKYIEEAVADGWEDAEEEIGELYKFSEGVYGVSITEDEFVVAASEDTALYKSKLQGEIEKEILEEWKIHFMDEEGNWICIDQ